MGYNLPKPTILNLGLKFILRGIEQDWYEFASNSLKLLHLQSLVKIQGGGGVVGGTLYNDLYGQAPPERGTFFKLQVYERVGISLVEVCERVGKSVTLDS